MDQQKRKIGLYGGTFNPIHAGHVQVALWTLENTEIDELWVMVTPLNPAKSGNIDNNYDVRLKAAKTAFARQKKVVELANGDLFVQDAQKRILISNYESKLPRPNYTINTLTALESKFLNFEFALIIGEDCWRNFRKWKNWDLILNTHIIYIYPRDCPPPITTNIKSLPKNVFYLKNAPKMNLSSTQIRETGSDPFPQNNYLMPNA